VEGEEGVKGREGGRFEAGRGREKREGDKLKGGWNEGNGGGMLEQGRRLAKAGPGYSLQLLPLHDLITSCSEDLFDNAHISNHCLHELLSSYVHRLESLRPRGHDLVLPTCTSYLHKRSFLVRALFEFI